MFAALGEFNVPKARWTLLPALMLCRLTKELVVFRDHWGTGGGSNVVRRLANRTSLLEALRTGCAVVGFNCAWRNERGASDVRTICPIWLCVLERLVLVSLIHVCRNEMYHVDELVVLPYGMVHDGPVGRILNCLLESSIKTDTFRTTFDHS
jgi:hypothetical protein